MAFGWDDRMRMPAFSSESTMRRAGVCESVLSCLLWRDGEVVRMDGGRAGSDRSGRWRLTMDSSRCVLAYNIRTCAV